MFIDLQCLGSPDRETTEDKYGYKIAYKYYQLWNVVNYKSKFD
jgi:hypothetical protein